MALKLKAIRYYYWIIREFVKKHLRLIMLSFFLTFFVILSLIVFTPYLAAVVTPKNEVIGIAGEYSADSLPDEVLSKISHGLVFINEKGEIIPALASSWEMRDGNKEFRFHLKKNLFWSDGKEFRAQDIKYKFTDVETKVVDDHTIYFRLKEPLAIFPTYVAKPIVKSPLSGIVGLYKVDRVKAKYGVLSQISLSPNKNDLPAVTYKFYDTESDLINAYKRGEINEMTLSKKSSADVFSGWKNTTIKRNVDYTKVLTLFFNLKNQALATKEMRQAIGLSILKDGFADQGELAQSPIQPVSWAYSTDIKRSLFDPDQAKRTIGKAEASASATLEFKTYYDYLSQASEVNDQLQEIGLKTNLSLISFTDEGTFDLLLAFWKLPPDPDQYYFWHSTQTRGNITNYKNVKVDKLLEDGRRNTISIKERKVFYDQFQKVLVDDSPAIFLYYPYVYTITRK